MKRAVSVSLGSSKRDKKVEIELLGERIRLERIGTDGDMEVATNLFRELDGKVDAFGVGGTDLTLSVDGRVYALHSVQKMVKDVHKTPIADGSGLKNTLESRLAPYIDEFIGEHVNPRRALITSGADRWGMTTSFFDAGYDCVVGDLMFALGLPIPLRSKRALKILAALLIPIVGRLPFEWLYPTGEKQEARDPKWGEYYEWGTVIAGDCHFISRYMPPRLEGKVIVTNTTTQGDVDRFREAGAEYLVTSTPVIDGRSFGTNMMEAALIAATGKSEPLNPSELVTLIDQLELHPQIRSLNSSHSQV